VHNGYTNFPWARLSFTVDVLYVDARWEVLVVLQLHGCLA
jgi:hypothetical protein